MLSPRLSSDREARCRHRSPSVAGRRAAMGPQRVHEWVHKVRSPEVVNYAPQNAGFYQDVGRAALCSLPPVMSSILPTLRSQASSFGWDLRMPSVGCFAFGGVGSAPRKLSGRKADSQMRKRKNHNVWFQQALQVIEDPAASGWLKNAPADAINRDPVDAAGDAAALSRILQQRVAAIQPGTIPSNSSNNTSKKKQS